MRETPQLQPGDIVWIKPHRVRGMVENVGVQVPKIVSHKPMIKVSREDGTGSGLYRPEDLRGLRKDDS